MDFAKTFDAIDHDLLLHKLAVYGLFPETLTLHHFLQLESKLHVNASTSSVRSVKCGVPQGSVFGPLLFSIYISGLHLFIKTCCELFADDATIHSSNSNLKKLLDSLQESVNTVLKWAEFNHVSLHHDKNHIYAYCNEAKDKSLL